MAWAILVTALLARTMLVVATSLLLWSLVPAAFGMTSTTVMSGSMAPAIGVGDEVVSAPTLPAQLHTGQVLLVDDPDHPGRLRLHRFATVRGNELVLRGDANAHDDSSPVAESAIRGVAFLRVPYAGLPMYWARTGQWGAEAAFVLAAGALVLLARAPRLLEQPHQRRAHARERARRAALRCAAGGTPGRAVGRPGGAKRRRLAAGATGAAALIAVPLVLGVGLHDSHPAMSAFSAASSTSTSTFGTGSFDCLSRALPAGFLGGTPTISYAFSEASGSSAANAGSGGAGTLSGNVDHVAGSCDTNASPAITVGAGGPGCVIAAGPQSVPGAFTRALWFRAATPPSTNGLLAGFGSSGTSTVSTQYDRQLTMDSTGTVSFRVGGATVTAPGSYADGSWHQAVVSLTLGLVMALTIDQSTTLGATFALGSFSGYWRFGNDAVSGSTPAPFKGQLDEIKVWNGIVLSAGDITRLLNAGH